ncbi:MAG TPA: glucose-1-phosphate adenylyltransferase [Armatimonadota bacterium]|nr:glucose-1-phosphate adenylyltransferase [Armatimonadota bacterium]
MATDAQNVCALILGGGRGTRLFPLTKDRAKPAVPLAGKYRLIDVPISNCISSNVGKMFVVTQFNSQSLHRHIHNAYKFDIFSENFVEILAAEQTAGKYDWYQGTADAVRRNLWHLTDPDIDRVLVLSGDQLYRMDFRDILQTHENTKAEITLAATPKRPDQAEGMGILKIDRHFRVVDFIEKPSRSAMRDLIIQGEDIAPLGVKAEGPIVLASMGIYLFNRNRLELALDNEMTDFGKNVIPWCIEHMRVFVHPFAGYWEDVGTIRTYFDAHMALTADNPDFDFYAGGQPLYTHPRFLPNSKIMGGSQFDHALISEGCIINRAKIERSVIGIRSVINEGSTLKDVIMIGQDDYETPEQREESAGLPARGIGANCQITRAIIDKDARIGDGVIITSHQGKPNEDGDCYYVRDGIVIIPKNTVVPDGRRI